MSARVRQMIHELNEFIDSILAENDRLWRENKFMKSRYSATSPKMDGTFTWIAKNHWPQVIGPNIDDAIFDAETRFSEAERDSETQ